MSGERLATDVVSREEIAQAADDVAESFMARYRQRPMGDGERHYDMYDAFSQFAQAIRCNTPGSHPEADQ